MQKKPLFILVIVGIVAIIGASLWFVNQKSANNAVTASSSSQSSSSQSSKPPEPIKPTNITLNTLFFGDVFWGRYVADWSQKSPLKYAYPFSGLNTFEREKYDAWIGSLNCPITPDAMDSATQDRLLKFNCLPEYTPEAAKWFNAFNLANSHTDNREEIDGFAKTRQYLDQNNIQYFGHHNKDVKVDLCEVVSFKARSVFTDPANPLDEKEKDYYMPIALCGFHDTF